MKLLDTVTPQQYQDIKESGRFYFNERTEEPDNRVESLSKIIDLKGKKVLDVGSLDGYIACSLASYGADVTTLDIRPKNLLTTLGRALLFGYNLKYLMGDIESINIQRDQYDIIFHSGVFYHLPQPVKHLFTIASLSRYLLLETHVADKAETFQKFEGRKYLGCFYKEFGWGDPCSSVTNEDSFWLTKESLADSIKQSGLEIKNIIYDNRVNEHGTRVCYLLERR